MKTLKDPRHQKRISLMQELFSYSFHETGNYASVKMILDKLIDIDTIIKTTAPEWPVDKIAKVDLAILRLAIFELNYDKSQPPKVIIDEAVELAKQFGNEHSPHFINGVLGTIYKDNK